METVSGKMMAGLGREQWGLTEAKGVSSLACHQGHTACAFYKVYNKQNHTDRKSIGGSQGLGL